MKCAIIGASVIPNTITIKQKEELKCFGKWLAEQKIEVLTGACGGIPHIIAKACLESGGEVKGFSPAMNFNEHINVYNHPIDGCKSFVFLDASNDSTNIRFLVRSISLINEADIVVCVEGNWGTLNELTVSVISGKKCFVLTGLGGISDQFDDLYKRLMLECKYDYGETIYFANNIENLCLQLKNKI